MRLREVLKKQTVFAFNCDDFVIYRGVVEAVRETNTPAIVQVSPGELNFWGLERFVVLAKNEGIPIFLNFDHSRDLSLVKKIVNLGVDMIHFDGSSLSWQENIDLTRQVVKLCHENNVLVEGEPQQDQTDPKKAAEFSAKTGVDLIAVFVGNRHGMDLKKPERIDFDCLLAIKKAVKEKGLTLHGGSGVHQSDIDQVIKRKLVSKININSRLRFVYLKKLKEELETYRGNKIYHIMESIVLAIKEEVKKCLT